MKRSTFAIVLVTILVLGAVGVMYLWSQSEKSKATAAESLVETSPEWRNVPDTIVVILIDTLRKDFLRPANAPFICNEFKPDCLSYENAYSNSSWTVPAVASLFT